MRQNNKRPAEEEAQPSRTSKRQAAAPSRRITRSMRKMNEDNGIPVQLHLGLPTASRPRKKPAPSAPTQRKCTPVQAPEQAATHVDPVAQPAAIFSSAPGEPGKHATEAANPGGPAPVADMCSTIPAIITSCHTDVPPQKSGIWGISISRQLRASSNSSQISPRSGPAPVCSVAPPSHAQTAYPQLDSGLHGIKDIQKRPTDIMLAWSLLFPAWVEVPRAEFTPAVVRAADLVKSIKQAGSDVCKATQTECKPAVLNATYLVSSIKEAGELLANEMDAQEVDETLELPVVEIFPDDFVSQASEHFSPMNVELSPVVVECAADNDSSADKIECPEHVEHTKERDLQCNTAMPDRATPTENIKMCDPPASVEPFCRSNAPSPSTTRGSICAVAVEQSLSHAKPLSESSKTTSVPTTAADMPRLPPSPRKTRQQIANLKREKELRAKLIEMRKAKRMARQPCVQNVLVRTSDGSMSIITAKAVHVTNWDLEDDQYSVEEYEEDTVSY